MICRTKSRWLVASFIATMISGGLTAPIALSQDRWTDSTGTRTIEAEFVELNGVQLKLKKADGGEAVLPLFKLDESSRRLARKRARDLATGAIPETAAAPTNQLPLAISPEPVVFPETQTLQEMFQLAESEYAKGNYLVDWDAIPGPYQGVIQDYFATAISKLDPPILQEIEQLKIRWVNVLKAKREFILNSPSLEWDADTKVMATNAYEPLVDLLAALPPGPEFDPAAVAAVPVRETMKHWIEKLMPHVDRVVQSIPGARESFFAARPTVANTRFIVINADSAQSVVTVPGKGPVTTDWIKFNKQWVPNSYQKVIDDIYFANERLENEDAATFNQKIRLQITAASLAAGVLEASETQKDIDDVLRGVKNYVRLALPTLLMRSGPNANQPGSSGYPNSGYPNSGYPNSGYPGSGAPQSGYPGSGAPSTGYPGSGAPSTGYPGSGAPTTGYPN